MIPLLALCLTAPLEFGLQQLPEDSPYRREGFTKFVDVIAPNGKPIRIIAQKGVRDIAVARCENLLKFYLLSVWCASVKLIVFYKQQLSISPFFYARIYPKNFVII